MSAFLSRKTVYPTKIDASSVSQVESRERFRYSINPVQPKLIDNRSFLSIILHYFDDIEEMRYKIGS
jgi:hypothetical protein